MDNLGELTRKVINRFSGKPPEHTPHAFMAKDAKEAFLKLVESATPVNSTESITKGEEFIISKYSRGTIFRETCFDENVAENEGLFYRFYCIGDLTLNADGNTTLMMYDLGGPGVDSRSKHLPKSSKFVVHSRQLSPNSPKREISIKIGEPGIITDLMLQQQNPRYLEPDMQEVYAARKTTQIDILQTG